jgi:cell division protein FtsQ
MRKSHQRAHSNLFRTIIVSFLFSIVIAAAIFSGQKLWLWMQKPTSFPIKQFHVEGSFQHETEKEVQQIIQQGVSGGFFSLDVSQAKEQLLAMPWVSHVSFRREWPGALKVRIDEYQAVAQFGKNGVLTTTGKVFYPDVKTIPSNLPVLTGPENQAEMLLDFYEKLNACSKSIGLSIVALNVDKEQSWSLQLSNQVQVILGRVDALKRFAQFILIYPKIVVSSKEKVVLIDLRYPNGVAVQYNHTPNH